MKENLELNSQELERLKKEVVKFRKNRKNMIPGSYEPPAFIKAESGKVKPKRNGPCLCGSGKKYKKCCEWKKDIAGF